MKKILVSCLLLALFFAMIGSANADFSPVSVLPTKIEFQAPKTATPQTTIIQFGGLLGIIYSPANIFINPGDHVRWEGDFTMHPLVSDNNLWITVNTGSQFEFVFTTPGVYQFHCFFHGAFGMAGTVTVGYRVFIPVVKK